MKIEIRIGAVFYEQILEDLSRCHPFAAERVGFAFGRIGSLVDRGALVLLTGYHAIPDAQYIADPSVGARIGSEAITEAMQAAYHGRPTRQGVFHVHLHVHRGPTGMSETDRCEIPKLLPGFRSVGRQAAHGILILSLNHGAGWVWLPDEPEVVRAHSVNVIGKPVEIFESEDRK
jgi:hypothetical protein